MTVPIKTDHHLTISALAPEASYEVVVSPRHDWADRITTAWRSSVEGIIACGRLLTEAKKQLPHGEFGEMIRADLPFGERTAQRLMKIALHPELSNPTHVSHLPASWGTLVELARLPPAEVAEMITDGRIRPDMERSEIGPKPTPKSKSKPARTSKPKARSDASHAALAECANRETAAREALSVLAELTIRAIGAVPVDAADVAAKWTDPVALERIIEWVKEVQACVCGRTRGR